jgi:RimJ/RimL family protein N-acetyltransferase
MIETERLYLLPLTHDQLILYTRVDYSLERALELKESSRTISPDLEDALESTILPNVADTQKNYLYSTLWILILKAEHKMVGDLCFYGEPNPEGEIEIGYGTYDEFQNKGYMTEAVRRMIEWTKTQPNVRAVIASTEKNNSASSKVLEKNGFKKCGETETLFKWRIEII